MYKAKITNVEKVRHQADEKDYLELSIDIIEVAPEDVTFDVVDGEGNTSQVTERVVSSQKHWLDPATKKADVLAFVEKNRAGWEHEELMKEERKDENAINENINELQAELVGFEVGVTDNEN